MLIEQPLFETIYWTTKIYKEM